MKTKHKENKALKRLNRNFLIAKAFLSITPILCYLYVSLKASMNAITFQEVLVKDPSTTIIFLIAMLNPYIAYLVHLIQNKLADKDYKFACMNMALLLIAQALTLNAFYFMVLAYVFYCAVKYYDIHILSIIKTVSVKQTFLFGGGSFIVILMSSISLFATIRLM
ncbi:MAG: hypothetical protein RR558_08180 [Coprobacillus sp.]